MKKVLAILLTMFLTVGLFTGCGNKLSEEIQVTNNCYLQIPSEWIDNKVEISNTDGVSFQTSENSDIYQYLSIAEYQGDFEAYMTAWIDSFSNKENFQIINQEDILIAGCNGKMTEMSFTSNGMLIYQKYYTAQNGTNVISINYMSDSNDYSLLNKCLETIHF